MSFFALAELLLVFGAVVGWAVYEIVSLRRYRRRTVAERAQDERPPAADGS